MRQVLDLLLAYAITNDLTFSSRDLAYQRICREATTLQKEWIYGTAYSLDSTPSRPVPQEVLQTLADARERLPQFTAMPLSARTAAFAVQQLPRVPGLEQFASVAGSHPRRRKHEHDRISRLWRMLAVGIKRITIVDSRPSIAGLFREIRKQERAPRALRMYASGKGQGGQIPVRLESDFADSQRLPWLIRTPPTESAMADIMRQLRDDLRLYMYDLAKYQF